MATAAPSAGPGSGTVNCNQAKCEFGPLSLRSLIAPETSEIVPTPSMRESIPVSVKTSAMASALTDETRIWPVVHGNPTVVAMFVRALVVDAPTDIATRPVWLGMLANTTLGDIDGGPPGVVFVNPTIAPGARSEPRSSVNSRAWHAVSAPPNTGCLQGRGPPSQPQSRAGVAAAIRDWSGPPNCAVVFWNLTSPPATGPGRNVVAAPVRPPARNIAEPKIGAGIENSMWVRTWRSLGFREISPRTFGPAAGRRNTPGGIVIFFGSGPDVCWINAFAGSGFTGINSGGNMVIVPIGLPTALETGTAGWSGSGISLPIWNWAPPPVTE